MKKDYESPKADVMVFSVKVSDVIMVSGGENDLPIIPITGNDIDSNV